MRMNLKLFRVKQGMTQAGFAKAVGYSRGQYAKIENGEKNMPLKLLENIQAKFNVSNADLLELAKTETE